MKLERIRNQTIRKPLPIPLVRLLLAAVRGGKWLWSRVTLTGGLAGRLLAPVAGLFFHVFVVRPYGVYVRMRRGVQHLAGTTSASQLLRHHQSILYLVVAAAAVVSLNSWRVSQAAAEDFGQHNLLFPLIKQDFELLVTESGSYLPPDGTTDTTGTTQDEAAETLPTTVPVTVASGGASVLKPYLVTSLPGTAARTRVETYRVESGDTVTGIAQRFGLNITTILWANNLSAYSLLRIGQELAIPPVNGVLHKIAKGDTVNKIASRYRANTADILAFNQVDEADELKVGDQLVVPGGRPPAAVPTPRPSTSGTPSAPDTRGPAFAGGKLLWPTAAKRITQYYTWRHTGVDIADKTGTPIYAAEDGVVAKAMGSGYNGGYGKYVIIDHGNGLTTLYGHASKLYVSVGDRVERGQQIADIGNTGRSTGPHLHFEVRISSRRVNPLSYIR